MDNIATALSDLAITRSLLLQRVANGISREVSDQYTIIIDDILKRLKSGDDLNIQTMNRIISELKTQIKDNAQIDITPQLDQLATAEATWAATSINGLVGIEIMKKLPSERILSKIAKTSLMEGATISDWFSSLNESTQFDVSKAIKLGVSIGEDTPTISKRVQDTLLVSKNHADSISRTAVATVTSQARQSTYDENLDVMKGYEHLSVLDSRTSLVCGSRDGAFWDLEHKGLNDKGKQNSFRKPPLHFRCLTGDTLVSTRYPISYISKREYQGTIYTLKTSSGNSIRCTPNHPILTDRGFIEAQFINESDKIITDLIGEGMRVLDNQDSKGVSTIENLFTSISESFGVFPVKMPVTPEDFHSDTTHNEVDVIFIDRELWFKQYAIFNEVGSDSSFIDTNSFAFSFSSLNKNIMRLCNSFSGFMTRLNLFQSFCSVHNTPLHSFLLRLASNMNSLPFKFGFNLCYRYFKSFTNASQPYSVFIQRNGALKNKDSIAPLAVIDREPTLLLNNSSYDTMLDAKLFRDILDGSLGDKVFADNIVSICIAENVLTHVYNLENDLNYYTANNLITHNCRSVLLPILKTYREMGIDLDEVTQGTRATMDGQVSRGTSFDKWFESKPKDFQENYLGKGRYELYKSGKITFSDLVSQNGKTLSISELMKL